MTRPPSPGAGFRRLWCGAPVGRAPMSAEADSDVRLGGDRATGRTTCGTGVITYRRGRTSAAGRADLVGAPCCGPGRPGGRPHPAPPCGSTPEGPGPTRDAAARTAGRLVDGGGVRRGHPAGGRPSPGRRPRPRGPGGVVGAVVGGGPRRPRRCAPGRTGGGPGQPGLLGARADPHRDRRPAGRRHRRTGRPGRVGGGGPRPGRSSLGPGVDLPDSDPGPLDAAGPGRAGPHLLHVGDHRRAQGSGAEPPEPVGRHRGGEDRLAVEPRGPAGPLPARSSTPTACASASTGRCWPEPRPSCSPASTRPRWPTRHGRRGASMFFGVPTMYHRLVASGPRRRPPAASACACPGRRRCPPSCTPRPAPRSVRRCSSGTA